MPRGGKRQTSFDSERAREAAKRSAEARRRKAEQRRREELEEKEELSDFDLAVQALRRNLNSGNGAGVAASAKALLELAGPAGSALVWRGEYERARATVAEWEEWFESFEPSLNAIAESNPEAFEGEPPTREQLVKAAEELRVETARRTAANEALRERQEEREREQRDQEGGRAGGGAGGGTSGLEPLRTHRGG